MSYTATEFDLQSSQATITLTVEDRPEPPPPPPAPAPMPGDGSASDDELDENSAPYAGPDQVRTRRNRAVLIRVLRNDWDEDGDRLRLVGVVRAPRYGRASVRSDGTILYRPRAGFVGRDVFRYRITDDRGGFASARVIVQVLRG